jgi:deoxyribose-phosphate aldolase
MYLTTSEIAKMMDLSCVQVTYTQDDLYELIETANKYGCGQISVVQCYLSESKELLKKYNNIRIVGNVSFPSGSDSTELKVIQAKQMLDVGVDEIDMVLNVNYLLSGLYDKVQEDVRAVAKAVGDIPLKVIIEASCLNKEQIKKACEICVEEGAAFAKTGTGWMGPTTVEHVKIMKSIIGDSIAIKAAGGVKSLELVKDMYKEGATRFGVNLEGGVRILEECIAVGGKILID